MSNRIDNASATTTVQVDTTRARTTAAPKTPFADVLQGGASALLTGAEVAGGAIGGPVVAAAIRQARTGVEGTGGTGMGVGDTGTGTGVPGGPNFNPNSELGGMFALQRESQAFNMQMLALQETVQQENRRFSTLTNVVRARHDTAKAATANVRA